LVAVVVSRPDDPPAGPPAAGPTSAAPQAATVTDPATADPCSLVDVASLQGFGTVTFDPDNNGFAGCGADIDRPNGLTVGYSVTFENPAQVAQSSGGRRKEESGYTVVDYEPGQGSCDGLILLDDGNAVAFYAFDYDGRPAGADLCAVVAAGRAGALTRLVEQGIGRRARLDESSPLAAVSACNLLAAEDIAAAVKNPAPGRPRFADWGCDWASYTGEGSVAVNYYRGFPLGEVDGTPADFAGHPGRVLARDGNCWVQFVQRAYTAKGSDRVETVWVTYWGQGTDAELCQTASTLATAAAGRLPPPT
jgi:hypothetical protein